MLRPLSVTFHKRSVHDVKTIDESVVRSTLIKNINCSARRVNLKGDKGYIATKKTKDELRLFKKGIKLITPYRKNQKKTNCNKNKQLRKLKKRYVVEHANQKMKDYNRTYVRRDRLLITFKSFIYMALGEKYIT